MQEEVYGTDPTNNDTDNDGLTDGEEINRYGTDPTNNDTDSDGMPDGWEVQYDLDPLADDADNDSDGDGLTNLEEYQIGTDPRNDDTDGDGFGDGLEVGCGTDPLNPNDYPREHEGYPWIYIAICVMLVIGLVVLFVVRRRCH